MIDYNVQIADIDSFTVRMQDMRYGKLYELRNGEIVIRTHIDIVVVLSALRGGNTYSSISSNSVKVRPLPKGSSITLTQED